MFNAISDYESLGLAGLSPDPNVLSKRYVGPRQCQQAIVLSHPDKYLQHRSIEICIYSPGIEGHEVGNPFEKLVVVVIVGVVVVVVWWRYY